MKGRPRRRTHLPEGLRRFFWDVDFDDVSWEKNFGYIVNRLLSVARPDVIDWLRDEIGDEAIQDEIVTTKARGLSYRQVARWIPHAVYDNWIAEDPNRAIWPQV